MAPRRAYPGRGGRGNGRSLRRPAPAAILTVLLVAALAACQGSAPDEGASVRVVPVEAADPPSWTRPTGTPRRPAAEWRGDFEIPALPAEALELEGAAGSLDGLLATVERGLAESDTARLVALMVSEREFRDILHPAFPAAHPPVNASAETVWTLQLGDAWSGLMGLLRDYDGRELRILDVRFARPDQDFVNFRLHETSEVDLLVDGKRRTDRFFGSVVQVGERWKVLSYPDDR